MREALHAQCTAPRGGVPLKAEFASHGGQIAPHPASKQGESADGDHRDKREQQAEFRQGLAALIPDNSS